MKWHAHSVSKSEKFGFDTTKRWEFAGTAKVNGKDYEFYRGSDGESIDICNSGCNGSLMKGTSETLPAEFIEAFNSL
jgi:hypothetical protein